MERAEIVKMSPRDRNFEAAIALGMFHHFLGKLDIADGSTAHAAILDFAKNYVSQIEWARRSEPGWKEDFMTDLTDQLAPLVGNDEVRNKQLGEVLIKVQSALC